MRSICCICHVVIGGGEKEGDGDSHGICEKCIPEYLMDQGFTVEEVKEFQRKHMND